MKKITPQNPELEAHSRLQRSTADELLLARLDETSGMPIRCKLRKWLSGHHPLPMSEMDEGENSDARRDDTGKFSTKYEPDDFVEALRRLGGAGSTKEIADEVGCARRTANYRLSDLQDDGRVGSREVGKSILWQVIDDDG